MIIGDEDRALRGGGERARCAIAIVGLACTFPGARTASAFWQNIMAKVDAITDVSPERWDPEVFFDPDPAAEDRIYCKRGGWIGDSFTFNPLTFGIMPSAVKGAEPDHFLVLRAAHEALEDAGYRGERTKGLRASVVLGKGNYLGPGVTTLMYRGIVTEQVLAILKGLHPDMPPEDLARLKRELRRDLAPFTGETAAGLIPNICTGRVANRFDFSGRNFTIDAACASSLVAVELAAQGLSTGQDDLVLAGGVHIFAHIPFLQVFDAMRALSLGSAIRPFDERCDGTMVGEGVGLLVLKRLEDAERDGDRIYAVIKGTGISSDGRAKGVTAPRVDGEELALRRAYDASGVPPDTIELIEGHGTGTPVGDAAEIEALRRVFGRSATGVPTCAVGSVKSMIGHAMPAAGAAGLIKAALALYHRALPPTLHCGRPRPDLCGDDSPFYVIQDARPWIHNPHGPPRRAGVSAFGFGGINGHVVLEEHRGGREEEQPSLSRDWESELVVVQADSRQELLASIERLRAYLADVRGVALRDVAYTLSTANASGRARLAVVATSLDDLATKLAHAQHRLTDPRCGHIKDRQGIFYFGDETLRNGKLALLFPGEGSQYAGMLSDLCIHFPQIRQAFDLADGARTDPHRIPPSAIIFPTGADSPAGGAAEANLWAIERATEAVLTADAALFGLLNTLGLRPDMITGHSAGEWVAMAAAEILDASELVSSMDRLSAMHRELAEDTTIPVMSMLAVGAGRERVERIVAAANVKACIANDNCHHQVVIVVEPREEAATLEQLRRHGLFVERLPYDRGYHTPAFTYICAPLREYFETLSIRPPRLPFYSCATATPYPTDREAVLDLASSTFARPLRFRETIEAMYADGARMFVEAGPRGNLVAFVDDILRGRPHLSVAIDQFRRPGLMTLNQALGLLTAAGVDLDLRVLYERRSPSTLSLDAQRDSVLSEDDQPGTIRISTCYPKLTIPRELAVDATRQTVVSTREEARAPVVLPEDGRAAMGPRETEFAVVGSTMREGHPTNGTDLDYVDERATAIEPDAGVETVLDEHFALMEELLGVQKEVIERFFGAAAAPAPPPAHHAVPDALSFAASLPEPGLLPSAPAASHGDPPCAVDAPHRDAETHPDLEAVLLQIVSQRTGYPIEMLGLDLDMEADLGIESIKKVEILGALRQTVEEMGVDVAADIEDVTRTTTLRQLLHRLEGASKDAGQSGSSRARPPTTTLGPLMRTGLIVDHVPRRSVTLRTIIDADEHLFLADHCLYFHASDRDGPDRRMLSMPLTGSLEIMAEAAALLCPDCRVVGVKGMRALQWITVEQGAEGITLLVEAVVAGEHDVRVTLRQPSATQATGRDAVVLAEATIRFDHDFPNAVMPAKPPLEHERVPQCTGSDIYRTRRMFHGPSFQGVTSISAVGDNGIVGRLAVLGHDRVLRSDRAPIFHVDPFLLDAAGQLVGYWPVEYLSDGFVALPIQLDELVLYSGPPTGAEVDCDVRIRERGHRHLKADFDILAPNGTPWMRAIGWTDWRFYWPRQIYEFWRFPNREGNGVPVDIPALSDADVECRRVEPLSETDKTGLWEDLWTRMILSPRERDRYRAIDDRSRRTEWLFRQAAAKDAVRMWLKRRRGQERYPTDIDIATTGQDDLIVHGTWTEEGESMRLAVSVHFDGQSAVAVAGPDPIDSVHLQKAVQVSSVT